MNRPISGKELLKLFKDNVSPAHLCLALGVEYKVNHLGYPTKETDDAVKEALIHRIIAIEVGYNQLLNRLRVEMQSTKYPSIGKDEWAILKIFETEE